jgi:hypothetical protein
LLSPHRRGLWQQQLAAYKAGLEAAQRSGGKPVQATMHRGIESALQTFDELGHHRSGAVAVLLARLDAG